MSSSLRCGLLAALVLIPALSGAHGGPGFPRQAPQSPLVGVPPTYIAPGTLPPTYIPPGTMPPWVTPSVVPPATNQFTIPSDPGLSQRNLLNEEMRLRGWDQGRWRNNERDERNWREQQERRHWNDPSVNPQGFDPYGR